ncbi:hypothetical protein [Flagellimonas myxillae]|uniref:hypothetical protein n=1 Tax=Flagellimonas myxillae TaxID=2942214 RepID=UPI00201E7523|nr:hypothetical protein [Muricauda myxillae]MCL6265319.1 hypothetical protein [Muricauda myxillae]
MRKLFFPILLLLIIGGCDDGDLQIETIDFNNVAIQFCDQPQASGRNIVFKTNETEALILNLNSGLLNKGVIGETIVTESSIPGQSQLTYRNFSGTISSSYFCDDIPPATPTVAQEVEAEDGTVIVETSASEDETEFEHIIRLSGVSFVTENGERITNLTIDEFGTVSTTISN